MSTPKPLIPARIWRRQRELCGLKLSAAASALNVSPAWLSQVEQGNIQPSAKRALMMSDFLHRARAVSGIDDQLVREWRRVIPSFRWATHRLLGACLMGPIVRAGVRVGNEVVADDAFTTHGNFALDVPVDLGRIPIVNLERDDAGGCSGFAIVSEPVARVLRKWPTMVLHFETLNAGVEEHDGLTVIRHAVATRLAIGGDTGGAESWAEMFTKPRPHRAASALV